MAKKVKNEDDLQQELINEMKAEMEKEQFEQDIIDEKIVLTPKQKKALEKAEIKRLKKENKKISKKKLTNLLIEQENLDVVQTTIDDDALIGQYKNKKQKESKLEKLQRENEINEKIIESADHSYIEVRKEKRKTRKIIRYRTDINEGLSGEIVEYRVKKGLDNSIEKNSGKSVPGIIFSNIFTFFNIITIAIFVWLMTVGAIKDCGFMAVVLVNVSIGIFQEIKSKKVIDKLSVISAPVAIVLRDSKEYDIPVNEIVLDDILILQSGKQICSDSIVVEGMIEVNESLLTGESDAIVKNVGDILYSGSFVVSGACKARVDKVGKENYIEKLTKAAKQYSKPKSDLLASLNLIIRVMAIIIIPIGAMLFLSQVATNVLVDSTGAIDWTKISEIDWSTLLSSNDYTEAVRNTAGAMIGMIPSGLFLLTSVALYVGVLKLSQNNTLVQELYCIEMLARVDVLCLDKTGTITDGTMKVQSVIEYDNGSGLSVSNAVSAMLNALNEGNLTSVALEEKFGRGKRVKHVNTIPFSSARKWNAVQFVDNGTFVLGAPEFVLKDKFHMIAKDVEKGAAQGMRVLLLAHTTGTINETSIDGELTPTALILIEDTIRDDAIETIRYFKESGVNVKVISGDNALTVSKVSERAGIPNADKYISLDGLTDKEVVRAASKYTIFGRVSPGQKKLLVKTLKSLGGTVAMTGDGVNDILALRESDCSIAIASGSEAARNVSHLVLLDSNFSSMPKAVAEGRRVINNVQKVASLYLTKTIFSLLLSLVAIIQYNGQYPIKTSQLLIIEMFVIGIPSIILAMEPNNRKVVGKFLGNVLKNALPGAIAIMISTLIIFYITPMLNIYADYIPEVGSNITSATLEKNLMATLVVINATFTSFMVLLKVSKPFNNIRRALFISMLILSVGLMLLIPDFFELNPFIYQDRFFDTPFIAEFPEFDLVSGILLVVLIQAAYPLMIVLENIVPWIKNGSNKVLKLIGKI
ncbi:MAG: HAD-IC family P-type ATPase [bacterium]